MNKAPLFSTILSDFNLTEFLICCNILLGGKDMIICSETGFLVTGDTAKLWRRIVKRRERRQN